jgi:carnitine O-acetyltransferase
MPTSTATVRTFMAPKPFNETLLDPAQAQPITDGGRSLDKARDTTKEFSKDQREPVSSNGPKNKPGITFAAQDKLPKLPIPELDHTMKKYLDALEPLQTSREHAETKQAVEEFQKTDGPELQERLKKYATGKTSYIEQFCVWHLAFIYELD